MNVTVPVRVTGELVIRLEDLPEMAFEQIKSALTIANEEREKQAMLKKHGWWDLPETIALWRTETRRGGEEVLCLPRGFSMALQAGMTGLGIAIEWDDRRTKAPAADGYYRPFVLRDYQLDAVLEMLKREQGFYKCPAGGGKTVTSLGAMAYANQRTLVVVDKAGLVEQWRARAATFFGMPTELDDEGHVVVPLEGERTIGKIGQDVWEERDLTVCLRQTLWSRAWELDATGWWQTWGMVFFDEGHHLAADTLAEVCRKMTSHYLLSVSATPAKSVAKGQMVHALVGPIIHETPRQLLYDRGILMRPTVEVLSGDIALPFHVDHTAQFDDKQQRWICQADGCKRKDKHSHRNNYSSVLKKTVEDQPRNARVSARIMKDRGHHHLVASSQLKHLNLIRRELLDSGWPEDKIWFLRGEENAKGLDQKIIQQVEAADEAVVLSTVAGEALDIPILDRLHIVFPMRDEGATIQIVGRVERVFPGKEDAIAIDYREPHTSCFEGQWDERSRTYRMQGYDIIESPDSVRVDEEVPA